MPPSAAPTSAIVPVGGSFQSGALSTGIQTDGNRSSGICLSCMLNSIAAGPLSLAYNSGTVNGVQPLLTGTYASATMPTQIVELVVLTALRITQQRISLTGHSAGDVYVMRNQIKRTAGHIHTATVEIDATINSCVVDNRHLPTTSRLPKQRRPSARAGLGGAQSPLSTATSPSSMARRWAASSIGMAAATTAPPTTRAPHHNSGTGVYAYADRQTATKFTSIGGTCRNQPDRRGLAGLTYNGGSQLASITAGRRRDDAGRGASVTPSPSPAPAAP